MTRTPGSAAISASDWKPPAGISGNALPGASGTTYVFPAFPKGVQIATLVGDPTKAGEVVVLRIKFPPDFQMPPHTHPYSEVVTIISGDVGSSHGEKFEKKGDLLKPGSLWVYPAKHAHYAWTGSEEGILQVQFIGPGGIDYINPADDPRKQ